MWLAKGAESILRFRLGIRIAGIERRTERVEHEIRGEVSLIENVDMRVRAQAAAVVHVAWLRIGLVDQAS